MATGATTFSGFSRDAIRFMVDLALFRWKDVVFGRHLTDREVCSPKLPDFLAEGYATAMPVFRVLATLRGQSAS